MSIAGKFEVIADAVYAKGETNGRQAQYDACWDALQNNGTRTNYTMMFANENWTDDVFNPKYDLVSSTFYRCWYGATKITRIPKTLDGSTISTSTGFNQAMYGMNNLVRVEKIISRKEAPWTDSFRSCSSLEEIRFDGIIGMDIDFSSCSELSDESVASIKDHLYDFPGNGSTETRSIKFHSKIKTKLGTNGIAEFTAKGWNVG